MARKSRQVETRMVSEFLKQTYGEFPLIVKQPLGAVSESILAAEGYKRGMGMMRPFRPEVDAVVILPRYLVLVEAKVWNVVNGLAKLPLYKSLVPLTPELQQYLPRAIIMELVVGWSNANLETMAREQGVSVRVFCPDWLKQVVDDMHKYWTPEYRSEREQRLAMREQWGLD